MMRKHGQFAVAVLLVSTALPADHSSAASRMVGVEPSDGVAMLVKRFSVASGATIVGVQFESNDPRTVFPEVLLVRGATSTLDEGTVVASRADVSGAGVVEVLWTTPVQVTGKTDFLVGIRIPAGPGKRGLGNGPAVGAELVATPNGSLLASGDEGSLTALGVDLSINLLTAAGKAGPPSSEPQAKWTGLRSATPNPFNPSTTIEFGVERLSHVRLRICDVAGRQVRDLEFGRVGAGTHRRAWDGRNNQGKAVSAGVYLVRLTVESQEFHRKIILVE